MSIRHHGLAALAVLGLAAGLTTPALAQGKAGILHLAQAGEDGLYALEVAEHRVAEHDVALPSHVARLGARLRAGSREVDEPVRLENWKRPEQQLIEQREDGRVGADAER